MTESTFQKDSTLWICGFLILANVFVYGQVLGHSFITYDDPVYITQNEVVMQGITWEGLKWATTAVVSSNWHPLTMLSHMLDVQLFGTNSGLHHLVNVLIHTLNALLAFHVLRRMTGAVWRPALVAALFALHPLRVESVAWASERKDVLSVMFLLLTLLAYQRYVEKISIRRYLLIALTLALGLMAKPMLVTVPVLLLLLDFWPLKRINLDEPARCIRRLVMEKIPLFAIAAAAAAAALYTQGDTGSTVGLDQYPIGVRLANAAMSTLHYLWSTLVPIDLVVIYPHPGAATWILGGLGCGVILFVITLAALRVWQSHPYITFGWFWYLTSLLPVVGLIQVGSAARADRYTYIPHLGLFIAAVWALGAIIERRAALKRPVIAASGIALLLLLVLSFIQVGYWRNDVTLFTRTLEVAPNNPKAHFSLGVGYVAQKNYPMAARHFERSLALNPGNIEARKNLGSALLDSGEPEKAEIYYREVIRMDPYEPDHYVNLAAAVFHQGDYDEAIFWAEDALRIDPEYERAHILIQEARRSIPPKIPLD